MLYDHDPLEFQTLQCNTAQILELDYFKDVLSYRLERCVESGHQSAHGPLIYRDLSLCLIKTS